MAKSLVHPLKEVNIEIDIFSNKSSLLLFWLLVQREHLKKQGFSINAAAREVGISLGLAHKVIRQLEFNGLVVSKGLRTNKKFYLKAPDKILRTWVQMYSLIRKTKTKGFMANTGIETKTKELGLVPALHLACADLFNVRSTNLKLKEFYLPEWDQLSKLVLKFDLQEMDRGYELFLIKPYYSALFEKMRLEPKNKIWKDAFMILTFLDLFNFPIRGIEQAEALFRKSGLSDICDWKDLEYAFRK